MKRLSATLPVRRLPTCDDALQCVSNLLLADLLEVTTRCKDGSLVHQVLQVSTSEAGGPAAQTTAHTAISQHEQRNLCKILYACCASCTSHSLPNSLASTSAATQDQMLVQRIQDHTCHQRILPPVTLLPPGQPTQSFCLRLVLQLPGTDQPGFHISINPIHTTPVLPACDLLQVDVLAECLAA